MFGRFFATLRLLLISLAVAGSVANMTFATSNDNAPAGLPRAGLPQASQVSPLTNELCLEMRQHKTLRAHSAVGCQRLALVKFKYFGFDGQIHDDGEIVVLSAAADRIAKIFGALLEMRFPIKQAKLLNHYEGDDEASMADDNTSAFNDRPISGSSRLSIHAYGLAIDLNPVQNPFRRKQNGTLHVSPKAGGKYLNRADARPGMAEAVIDVFAENGFPIWGGDWRSPIDYQHFQVDRDLAKRLAQASNENGKVIFEEQIKQYRHCRDAGKTRKACIAGIPS
jgi:D-alanyl-D-alanine carboxypeptidase